MAAWSNGGGGSGEAALSLTEGIAAIALTAAELSKDGSRGGSAGAEEPRAGESSLRTGDPPGACHACADFAAAGEMVVEESAGDACESRELIAAAAAACGAHGVYQGLPLAPFFGGVFWAGFKPRCGPSKSGQLSCTAPPNACCESAEDKKRREEKRASINLQGRGQRGINMKQHHTYVTTRVCAY